MDEDAVARDYLPRMNALVRTMLRSRKSPGAARQRFDEAIAAGMIGLVRAFRSFDATRGAAFATYADMVIRNHIIDHWRSEAAGPETVPIDEVGGDFTGPHHEAPGWATEYAEWVGWLSRRLPPRHGELVRLHYLAADSAELHRCARRMGLKPNRASEIHSEAIGMLRESFGVQARDSHRAGELRGTARSRIADVVKQIAAEGKTPSIPAVAKRSGYSVGHVGSLRRPMIEAGEWPDVDGRKRIDVA